MVLEISKQKTLWFQMNGRRGPSIHTHSENSGQLGPPDPVVGIQLLPALALPGEPGARRTRGRLSFVGVCGSGGE